MSRTAFARSLFKHCPILAVCVTTTDGEIGVSTFDTLGVETTLKVLVVDGVVDGVDGDETNGPLLASDAAVYDETIVEPGQSVTPLEQEVVMIVEVLYVMLPAGLELGAELPVKNGIKLWPGAVTGPDIVERSEEVGTAETGTDV